MKRIFLSAVLFLAFILLFSFIPASATSARLAEDAGGYLVIPYRDVTAHASSELTDRYGDYPAVQANDASNNTVWSEGASGNGEGEWLEFSFPEQEIAGFTILGGYQKSKAIYRKNSRPREIIVTAGDEPPMTVELDDVREPQTVLFDQPVLSDYLTITLSTFYNGTKYKDTCITDVSILTAGAEQVAEGETEQTPATGSVIAGMLTEDMNLYKLPRSDAEVLQYSIRSGSTVTLLMPYEADGQLWYKVDYHSIEGYMMADYIQLDDTARTSLEAMNMEAKPVKGTIVGAEVLHSKAWDQSNTGLSLVLGAEVTVLARVINEYGEWYHIQFGDVDGYTHAEYVLVDAADKPYISNQDVRVKPHKSAGGIDFGAITEASVPLYEEPDDTLISSMTLLQGDKVAIVYLDEVSGWDYVMYNGIPGYIKHGFLKPADPEEYTAISKGVILYDGAEIKSRPFTEYYSVKGKLKKGDEVLIYSNWYGNYAFDHGGKVDFVRMDQVRLTEGNPQLGGLFIRGNKTLQISLGSPYSDPGYVAYDEYGKDATDQVKVYGTVDTGNQYTYTLTYEYIQSRIGDKISLTRKVSVS